MTEKKEKEIKHSLTRSKKKKIELDCAVENATSSVVVKSRSGLFRMLWSRSFFLTGRIHKIKALRRGNCRSGHEAVHQMNEKKFPR